MGRWVDSETSVVDILTFCKDDEKQPQALPGEIFKIPGSIVSSPRYIYCRSIH